MEAKELKKILDLHKKWLNNDKGGERADLSSANLSSADLSSANLDSANLRFANLDSANLSSANLDSACWPLWCGSIGVKIDKRLKRQLLYHLLAVAPEYRTESLVKEANKFHRVITKEVPVIK